jgi:hypothetical protein
MMYRGGFWGSPCVPSLVLGIRIPKLPLLPWWEKRVGGMRGKSVWEYSKEKGRQESGRGHAAHAPVRSHKVERGRPVLAGL